MELGIALYLLLCEASGSVSVLCGETGSGESTLLTYVCEHAGNTDVSDRFCLQIRWFPFCWDLAVTAVARSWNGWAQRKWELLVPFESVRVKFRK